MTGNHPDLEEVFKEDEKSFMERIQIQLEKLETVRKEKLSLYKFRKKVAMLAAVPLTPICATIDWWLLLLQRGSDDSAAGITFAVLGGLYWWATEPKRQYTKEYKKKILPKLAGTLGLDYQMNGRIPMSSLKPSKIVPAHDRYETEDYFEGAYKDVHLRFSEIDLKQRRRGKNRTYYVTIFKGLAVLIDMKGKKFYGHTVLLKDSGKLFEWFKEKSFKLDRANLVDPEFEKIFDAYTNDQVEARYLVDPKMIEELKGLYHEYEGEKMMAAYYDSQLLVLIASKHNHFEPADIYTKATDPVSIRNMRREISSIISIIDRLDLYDPVAVHEEAA